MREQDEWARNATSVPSPTVVTLGEPQQLSASVGRRPNGSWAHATSWGVDTLAHIKDQVWQGFTLQMSDWAQRDIAFWDEGAGPKPGLRAVVDALVDVCVADAWTPDGALVRLPRITSLVAGGSRAGPGLLFPHVVTELELAPPQHVRPRIAVMCVCMPLSPALVVMMKSLLSCSIGVGERRLVLDFQATTRDVDDMASNPCTHIGLTRCAAMGDWCLMRGSTLWDKSLALSYQVEHLPEEVAEKAAEGWSLEHRVVAGQHGAGHSFALSAEQDGCFQHFAENRYIQDAPVEVL